MQLKHVLAVAAVTGAGCLAAVPPATGGISGASGTFRCQGSAEYGRWSPISAGPNTYIVGNCAPGTEVRRTYYDNPRQQNGHYAGGYIGGSFNGCGAVQMRNLSARVTAARTSFCTPVGNGKRDPREFVLVVDCKGDNAPCRRWDPFLDGDRDTIVTKACQAYANVRPFGRRTVGVDPVQIITPANRADPNRPGKFKVWWRYVTRDGRWVMVHDAMGKRSGGAIWVFVAAGCVRSPHAPMSP